MNSFWAAYNYVTIACFVLFIYLFIYSLFIYFFKKGRTAVGQRLIRDQKEPITKLICSGMDKETQNMLIQDHFLFKVSGVLNI
jgi:hypothetical protein